MAWNKNGRKAEAKTATDFVVLKNADISRSHVSRREEKLDRTARVAYRIKVHRIAKDRTQRIDVERVELVGRKQPSHDIELDEGRRCFERLVARQPVKRGWL